MKAVKIKPVLIIIACVLIFRVFYLRNNENVNNTKDINVQTEQKIHHESTKNEIDKNMVEGKSSTAKQNTHMKTHNNEADKQLVETNYLTTNQLSENEANKLLVTDLAYVKWYSDKYGIDLYGWDKYKKLLTEMKQILSTSNEHNMIFLRKEGDLLGENSLVRTADINSQYVYLGKLKDNKPDGIGALYTPAGDCYYMGGFKDGMYSGFGVEYHIPDANDEQYLMEVYGVDALDNNRARINYCCYMGDFDENTHNGKGNQFSFPHIYYDLENAEFEANRHVSITIADFSNGEIVGRFKNYANSYLLAEGNIKKNLFSTEGTAIEYYPSSTQIKYKGDIKDGQYHGKGTMYDEQGNVLYSGKWEYGDYAN